MSIDYINRKIREINLARNKIMKEMSVNKTEGQIVKDIEQILDNNYKRSFNNLKEMKVACIMDEFTYNSYQPECILMQVTPENWLDQMITFKPDLFFLESAWRGKDGLWHTKVPHLSNELIDLLSYCKKNDIPIIFWNKEDPVHFDTFLATAKYADFVFTTDIDCIKKYKTMLKHNRVYLLPFAAQLEYHNPIEAFEREDKFCFAGAYYKRYPERVRDLEAFIEIVTQNKGLDIYDRNYFENDPNYSFPSSYKKYIKGNLKPTEIEKAYKGYRFNINMNSVKQSQSMCARRVYELLASNTVTVSNYSRAIRNLFGDLVVCTDDGQELSNQINKFSDIEYYNKYRLLGLRKVLSEHTYTHRLNFIVNKVYENTLELPLKRVAIISKAETEDQLHHILSQYKRQTYTLAKLFIVLKRKLEGNYLIPDNVEIFNEFNKEKAEYIKQNFEYVTYFSSQDYYGANYINDYILATQYTEVPVVGKSMVFENFNDSIIKNTQGVTYSITRNALIRRSLIKCEYLVAEQIVSFTEFIDESIIPEEYFAIDEYNYCASYSKYSCPVVDDFVLTDQGLTMDKVNQCVQAIEESKIMNSNYTIDNNEMFKYLKKSNQIDFTLENDGIQVVSNLEKSHEYTYLNKDFDILDLNVRPELDIYLDVDYYTKFGVEIVALLLDKNKNKIEAIIKPSGRKISVNINPNVKYIRFGIRFSGIGSCNIKKLIVGNIQFDNGCFLSKSNAILITDNYPDYQNLYRYAFVHSRIYEYKKNDLIVDIFKFNEREGKCNSEFSGVDISSGYIEELSSTLIYGDYDTYLIHFLNETIWESTKKFIESKRAIVWIHGSEIQPWWRREYNYSTQQELEKAKEESKSRVQFWQQVFEEVLLNKWNVHFVFVSNYFAQEVFEDLKVTLPENQYSIIHNYINSELFEHNEKDIESRTKILSIRPFASAKYANDLTVKAIQHLSKESFFSELDFMIIGKGELFKSTVKPIRKFKNVKLEERFLRQEEIASIHKEYGIFLVPTRMDSQGVSRDEAMSSGLVPITNNVAAIPEFVDGNSGVLVEEEDHIGLAEGIKKLYYNPQLFLTMSKNATQRVRNQSGFHKTILKEIEIIKGY
ncbi:glycosyltransferase [Paenibacillus sp. MDMC362]|uniref:glycosyltransferase family protein n=1 Tax=Paenibacillus sp. MDMC362 TaxID=2977365 RepID=UPI000DC342E3|nr:glycosyltransferase [Paenibacillus sp. MDMC362]RAR42395.1 methyltransferase type 12 [Paenibacillus sp. MDMC362]